MSEGIGERGRNEGRGSIGSPHFILIVVNICKCIRQTAAEYHIEFQTYPREREGGRERPPQSFRLSLLKNWGHSLILIAMFVLFLDVSSVHAKLSSKLLYRRVPRLDRRRCLATKQEEVREA